MTAIINALFNAETMIEINGNTRYELPFDWVERIFKIWSKFKIGGLKVPF